MEPLTTNLIVVPSQFEGGVLGDEDPNRARPFRIQLEPSTGNIPQNAYGGAGESHNFEGIEAPGDKEKLETPEFPHPLNKPLFTLTQRYGRFKVPEQDELKTFAGHALIPNGDLYLFNVIVALEWVPSKHMIDILMRAFRSASDVLYDATNGGMAFGQVVFAGRQYLDRADVQIMASNRFHPRSMVNGLLGTDTHPPSEKFSPIRLGRGIWRKDRHILLPWNESTGYRAIAHEWAHYALGLHDEYIDTTLRVVPHGNRLIEDSDWGVPIVIPRVLISLQTLMETLESDELVPFQHTIPADPKRQDDTVEKRRERELAQFLHALPAELKGQKDIVEKLGKRVENNIEKRFPGIKDKLAIFNPGPNSFPAALPQFFQMPGFEIIDEVDNPLREERICSLNNLTLDHCWLYSLRYEDDKLHIIAQGSVDERRDGFEFLGAQDQDTLLAIGLDLPAQPAGAPQPTGIPALQKATLADKNTNWAPPIEKTRPPVIAVLPITTGLPWPMMKVKVQVSSDVQPDKVWLSSPGDKFVERIMPEEDRTIKHMDGIIALEWDDGTGADLWVAEFSYGGNPPTVVKSPGAPINAGSSDGNLMIFSGMDSIPQPGEENDDDYKTIIVTTRNYGGFEDETVGRPAGYLFSVASSDAIDAAKLNPTIVMYYDGGALEDGRDLVIHRYDNSQWQPLPTYLPSGGSFAATPINAMTAPSLVEHKHPPAVRVEYYRLFSVPR